jgi:hypothetical protein
MIYTYDLIVLTKTKEMTRYYESVGYGGKTLSTHVSIILTQVSVPTENGSKMPLRNQHFHAHSCP